LSDEATKTKPPVRIFEGDLTAAEYARTVHVLTAPAGAQPDDFLEAETYAHALRKLRPRDRIEVFADDNTWWCEVLILGIAGQLLHVAMLDKRTFAPMVGKEHEAYDVAWGGPAAKWRVLRKSDRAVMQDKFDLKSEAIAWIEENAGKPVEPLKKAA
jgi:hypothetical protein